MASKLWSGRFSKDLGDSALSYSSSVDVDRVLFFEDVWVSQAHAIMLARRGIISKADARKILFGLKSIEKDFGKGKFKLKASLEDVHLNIEKELARRIGKVVAGKLHTARSRNDQVAAGFRMHLRGKVLEIQSSLVSLEQTLAKQGRKHSKTIMPGYTHLQRAQPITLGFWMVSQASIFLRDLERLGHAYTRINQNPLGSCALSGTSFPVDRKLTTRLLAFDSVVENAMDASSSRDFVLELLSNLSILSSNLSRVCEDMILWSGSEFGFLALDDSLATGSSIMPQKKNPDLLELMRARTGRVFGNLTQALVVVKGVPSGYSRDLQEDKVLLSDSIDVVNSSIKILNEILKTSKWNKKEMRSAASGGFLLATELADYLTREKKLPFREAHYVVGTVVGALEKRKKDLGDVKEVHEILKKQKIRLTEKELKGILNVESAVTSHSSLGGTAPTAVLKNIKNISAEIRNHTRRANSRMRKIEAARRSIGAKLL
ncbi:argininosuccinate lyase [Candidatus Altiarchaeota archaeon]